MLTFTTHSGSVYEVDESRNRVRKLHGRPTARQGKSGRWNTYINTPEIEVGYEVLFVWRIKDSVAQTTLTSKVEHIEYQLP